MITIKQSHILICIFVMAVNDKSLTNTQKILEYSPVLYLN